MAVSLKKVEKWAAKKNAGKLIKALSSKEKSIKLAVVTALGTTGSENAMHALISMLKDPDSQIRAGAAGALGAMGNSRSLEFVKQVLNTDTDETVLDAARKAIVRIRENTMKIEG